MTLFSSALRELRETRGLTQEALADKLGVSKSAVSMYERGEREPSFEMMESIADIFNVDMNRLHGKSYDLPPFENIIPFETKKIPLLGEIAAGVPIFAEQDYESYVNCGNGVQADFALRVKGDSMINARIMDGDIVFIHKQSVVENGEIAAVIIDDEATLKRLFFYSETQKLVLSSENAQYPPFVFVGAELENVRVLGKAIAFQSDVR